ncbi:MAG: 6,7-dimethyl-8-ribityllumazine synthase [Patescibacteria group bacterium]
MSKGVQLQKHNGRGLTIGIVRTRWNDHIVRPLFDQAMHGLLDCGVSKKNIRTMDVPGSYELVFGAKMLIEKHRVDAVVCIGAVLKGGTTHAEYISEAITHGIMRLSLDTGVPIIFGVLTSLTEEQARERSVGSGSHGYDWGLSAVEMGLLKKEKK